MSHPTDQTWRVPPSHVSTATPDAVPPGTFPRDTPGTRACTGYHCGTDWRIWPNNSDRYQDHQPGLLSQQVHIQHGVLVVYHNSGWRRTGGSGPGRMGLTSGMEHRVNALPRAEHGELWGCHWRKMDPTHHHIPPYLHPGALSRLGGGPNMIPLPISHSVRVHILQHLPIPDPSQSVGRWSSDGVRVDGPPPPLLEMLVVPEHEDVVSGETRQFDAGKRWLHLGDILAPLWNGGNKGV